MESSLLPAVPPAVPARNLELPAARRMDYSGRMRALACLLMLVAAVPAHPLPPWKTLKDDHFTVFYREGQERQAAQVLSVLEHARPAAAALVGKAPPRVSVVVQEAGLIGNAFTDPVFHRIELFAHGPEGLDIGFYQSWWRLAGVHEYTHWAHLSAAFGVPGALSFLFGTYLSPQEQLPSWFVEGISAYQESQVSPYEGRLNEGTFRAYAAARAAEGWPSLAEVTFEPPRFPGATGERLYGGLFLEHLAATYGRESLTRFLTIYGSSVLSYLSPLLPLFGADLAARRAFGEPLGRLWRQWWEQLAAAGRASAGRDGAPVQAARGGWDPPGAVLAGGMLYFRRSRRDHTAPYTDRWRYQLVRLDPRDGGERVLAASPAPWHGPLRVRDGALYFATLDLRPGFANLAYGGYGFVAALRRLPLSGGPARLVLAAPLRTFEVLPGGTVLYSVDRPESFGSVVYALSPGSTTPLEIGRTELQVTEILAAEGSLYIAARREGSNPNAFRVERADGQPWAWPAPALRAGGLQDLRLHAVAPTPYRQFELAQADGRLYFTANHGGVEALYRYDPETGLARLTGGPFAAQAAPDPASGLLYHTALAADGYHLVREALTPLPFSRPAAPPRQPAPEAAPGRWRRGGYGDNLATLWPSVLAPIAELDLTPSLTRVGALLMGASALGDLSYALSGYYDLGAASLQVELSAQAAFAGPLRLALSVAAPLSPQVGLSATFPLLRRLGPGLTLLQLGVAGRAFGVGFGRTEVSPSLASSLSGAGWGLSAAAGMPLELRALGSDRDELAFTAGVSASAFFSRGQVGLSAQGVYDAGGYLWSLPAVRGYPAGLTASLGAIGRLEAPLALLRPRAGLWSVPVYFQDLFLVPFLEAAVSDRASLQTAGGAELHLEIKALAFATGAPLDLYVWAALTGQGAPAVGAGLTLSGFGDLLFRERGMEKWGTR